MKFSAPHAILGLGRAFLLRSLLEEEASSSSVTVTFLYHLKVASSDVSFMCHLATQALLGLYQTGRGCRILMNERLKHARARKRWTQEEAAEKIGVARKTYIEWEQGKQLPHMSTLNLACDTFQASPEDLGYSIRSGRITLIQESVQTPILTGEQIASLLILLGDTSMKFDASRRTILQLLGLASATLATKDIFDPEPWERLSYAHVMRNEMEASRQRKNESLIQGK